LLQDITGDDDYFFQLLLHGLIAYIFFPLPHQQSTVSKHWKAN